MVWSEEYPSSRLSHASRNAAVGTEPHRLFADPCSCLASRKQHLERAFSSGSVGILPSRQADPFSGPLFDCGCTGRYVHIAWGPQRGSAGWGRGLQGRGRGFDMGSITVPDRSLQRQKKPSVTLVFCKLRPSFSLSRRYSWEVLG